MVFVTIFGPSDSVIVMLWSPVWTNGARYRNFVIAMLPLEYSADEILPLEGKTYHLLGVTVKLIRSFSRSNRVIRNSCISPRASKNGSSDGEEEITDGLALIGQTTALTTTLSLHALDTFAKSQVAMSNGIITAIAGLISNFIGENERITADFFASVPIIHASVFPVIGVPLRKRRSRFTKRTRE